MNGSNNILKMTYVPVAIAVPFNSGPKVRNSAESHDEVSGRLHKQTIDWNVTRTSAALSKWRLNSKRLERSTRFLLS